MTRVEPDVLDGGAGVYRLKGKFMALAGDSFDKLSRLEAMVSKNQQTWDLSTNDVSAIQMAVDVLNLLIHADREHAGHLEMYDVDDKETPKMLCIGASDEHYGETAFECFVSAGASLRVLNAT